MNTYRAHPRYRLLAGLTSLLSVLMGVTLFRSRELGSLLFLLICLALACWYGWTMCSRVELLPDGVVLHRPFVGPQMLAFRQLLDVHEEGRTGRSILLHYHPIEQSGLLDLDRVVTLSLPSVSAQTELLDHLNQHVPT